MSTSETLILIQTIILFITGLVVVWYTYETYKIRKETSKQNTLLAEELNILRETNKYQIEKEKSFLQPIIVNDGGRHNLNHTILSMRNDGGYIHKISFETENNLVVKVNPKTINSDSRFKLELMNIRPNEQNEVHFTMNYSDKLDNSGTKSFCYNTKAHTLTENTA